MMVRLQKLIFMTALLVLQILFVQIYLSHHGYFKNISYTQLADLHLPLRLDPGWTSASPLSHEESPPATGIPILLYHGIVSKPDGYNVPISEFRDQMLALHNAGYHAITLEEFYSFIREGKSVPEGAFLLTFDDGRKDSYYNSDPILQALDWHAVIFAITGYSIEKEPKHHYLSSAELGRMAASGRWSIQSHSYLGHGKIITDAAGSKGYFFSSRLWLPEYGRAEDEKEYLSRIQQDLMQSKLDILDVSGSFPIAFAYPYGETGHTFESLPSSELHSAVQQIFPLTFIQHSPARGYTRNLPGSGPLLRINIRQGMTPDEILSILGKPNPETLPYTTTDWEGWTAAWGDLERTEGALHLSGQQTALAFLDTSYIFDDYLYKAQFGRWDGGSISLISRYIHGSSYLSCDFREGSVLLREFRGGDETLLGFGMLPRVLPRDRITLEMASSGTHARCIYRGQTVASTEQASIAAGGIGFSTWSKEGEVSAVLRRAEVTHFPPKEDRSAIQEKAEQLF